MNTQEIFSQIWNKNKERANECIENEESGFMINYSDKSFAFKGQVKDFGARKQ